MRLKENSTCPIFKVKDIKGQDIDLRNYKGKYTLVSFYRYASCPLCNLRISELIENEPLLKEKGLSMIAFFESSNDTLNKYMEKQKSPFPIIGDPKRKIYKNFGVEASLLGYIIGGLNLKRMSKAFSKGFKLGKSDGIKTLLPADFLLDSNHKIIRAYYGKDIGDHLPIEELFALIR
ncbi:redoxin domain-containing protein [Helicovermis profundi]|uniref:thioredoxin-dependent peroxiredoxin n=1 Tax=Helicovermis profundi TaxID=3065157 RepID=A0AAU9EWS4_9FIRM|nr:peroxiredoxin-like family protein [Clostridia bacterium S502]